MFLQFAKYFIAFVIGIIFGRITLKEEEIKSENRFVHDDFIEDCPLRDGHGN